MDKEQIMIKRFSVTNAVCPKCSGDEYESELLVDKYRCLNADCRFEGNHDDFFPDISREISTNNPSPNDS